MGEEKGARASGVGGGALCDEGVDDVLDGLVAALLAVGAGAKAPICEPLLELVEGGGDDGEVVVGRGKGDELEEEVEAEGVRGRVGEREGVEEGREGAVARRERGVGLLGLVGVDAGEGGGEVADERGVLGVGGGVQGEDEREDEVGEALELLVGGLEADAVEARDEVGDDGALCLAVLVRLYGLALLELLVIVSCGLLGRGRDGCAGLVDELLDERLAVCLWPDAGDDGRGVVDLRVGSPGQSVACSARAPWERGGEGAACLVGEGGVDVDKEAAAAVRAGKVVGEGSSHRYALAVRDSGGRQATGERGTRRKSAGARSSTKAPTRCESGSLLCAHFTE